MAHIAEYVRDHPQEEGWNLDRLAKNPHLPLSEIGQYVELDKVDLDCQFEHPGMTFADFLRRIETISLRERRYRYRDFLQHGTYTLEEVIPYFGLNVERGDVNRFTYIGHISKNRMIPLEDFLRHSSIGWDLEDLSGHPEMTLEIVKTPPSNWVGSVDWSALARSGCITLEEALTCPELSSQWNCLAQNPNLPLPYILDHPETTTQKVEAISRHPNLTVAEILAYPQLPWTKGNFGACIQIPLEWLCQHQLHHNLSIPWYVRRTDLTLELTLQYPELWSQTLQHGC